VLSERAVADTGGATAWFKVVRVAEAGNLPMTSHGVHDPHEHLLAAVLNAPFRQAHRFRLEPFLCAPLPIPEEFAIALRGVRYRIGHRVRCGIWRGISRDRDHLFPTVDDEMGRGMISLLCL